MYGDGAATAGGASPPKPCSCMRSSAPSAASTAARNIGTTASTATPWTASSGALRAPPLGDSDRRDAQELRARLCVN